MQSNPKMCSFGDIAHRLLVTDFASATQCDCGCDCDSDWGMRFKVHFMSEQLQMKRYKILVLFENFFLLDYGLIFEVY